MRKSTRPAPTALRTSPRFDRANLYQAKLASVRAHAGRGLIDFARVAEADALEGSCNFIDYVELPAGTSIGEHAHRNDEEEFYLVMSGEGEMRRNGEVFRVHAGDLIRNPLHGRHGLKNDSTARLCVFVFEVKGR